MFNPYAEELTAAEGESLLNQGGWQLTERFAAILPYPVFLKGDKVLVFDAADNNYVYWKSKTKFENNLNGSSYLLLFGELPSPFDAVVEREISVLIAKGDKLGIRLDFSMESLQAIDEHFEAFFYGGGKLIPNLFFPLVFYFGQTVLRYVNGAWICVTQNDFNEPWLIIDGKKFNVNFMFYRMFTSYPEKFHGLEIEARELIDGKQGVWS